MKKGFTVVSLVLYVMLFFTFTVFATAVSSNLNQKVLSEKAIVIINESYIKLYTNLINSAKKSNSLDIINSKLIFSNGDIYEYNLENKKISKNKGNFVQNMDGFTVSSLSEVLGLSNDINEIDLTKCFRINVSFKKYNETINKNIVITLGDDMYE